MEAKQRPWNCLIGTTYLLLCPPTRTCDYRRLQQHSRKSGGGDETLSATVFQMDEHKGASVLLALRILLKPSAANADEKVACSNLESELEKWPRVL